MSDGKQHVRLQMTLLRCPPMPSTSARLQEELKSYGVAPENVHLFDQDPKPELEDYLTLNALRLNNQPSPDGVAEYQGRPVLYFVDEQRLTKGSGPSKGRLFDVDDEPKELPVIFRQLACRGERVYLARIEFGRLRVAPVSPTAKKPNWVEYTPGSAEGKCLFSRLAFGFTEGEDFAAGDSVFNKLFRLLKHAANQIAKDETLRHDALSLVGRALFFRFLQDRGVLDDYPVQKIAPNASKWTECFADPKNAADTCAWLDDTFNGDFLELSDHGSEAFFRRIGSQTNDKVFKHLKAVVRGDEPHGADYQPLLDWNWQAFDFAHIPVGLLSQVYEAFSWEWTPKEARKTSQHYTPRNIALTLVEEVFDQLPDTTKCRILDPACGAGVFLVLAFRRLYQERWKNAKSRERPGTKDIRWILENQLVGLDISESALKLAALSLYLTAIELDPIPKPPDKLRFKNLRGHVLHDVREPGAGQEGAALGSLGPHLGVEFDGQFDVVVSNPPWTSVNKTLGKRMATVYETIIQRAGATEVEKHRLPDNNPDLPFLWKATEWCKPGGRIAMALPARILLKTEDVPRRARATLLNQLQVDGIINGTNLSDTPVWPKMNQPWMLLFATNRRPQPRHCTYFVTLPLDVRLNMTGHFRIDSESALPIDTGLDAKTPWLWKALSVGTILDLQVVDKIKGAGGEPLNAYWRRTVGKNRTGEGYKTSQSQADLSESSFLRKLPDLSSTTLFRFTVDTAHLQPFGRRRIHRPRKSSIYDPPLVLIKQAPGEDRESGRALLAFDHLAFSRNFNGYSGAGHPHGKQLVRYLHLLVHSDIWLYYVLVTSPQFGAERRRFHIADLERFPILPFENLNPVDRAKLSRLSQYLETGRAVPWEQIDTFFANLYKLQSYDLQVIKDTLAVALPYENARKRACNPPTEAEKKEFVGTLNSSLSPFVSAVRRKLVVERWKPPVQKHFVYSPFELLVVSDADDAPRDMKPLANRLLTKIIDIADDTGATQVVLEERPGLIVGIYNQYRYWTRSRARLLAGDIIRKHLDAITE